jgi:hypothetical protein
MASEETKKHRESIRDIRNVWLSMGYDDPAIFSDVEIVDSIDTDEATA